MLQHPRCQLSPRRPEAEHFVVLRSEAVGWGLRFWVWISCGAGGKTELLSPTCSGGRQSGLLIRSELANN